LSDFEALSLADMTWLSLPTLLQIQDRNSMAASVECRTPFLDRRLVELGLALPAGWKIRHSWGKWILRKAMSPLLPRRIAWSPVKRGFATDNALWLERGAGAWLRARIADGANLLDGVDSDLALAPGRYTDSVLLRSHQRLHEALAVAWLVTWRAAQGGPRLRRPSA
jgi:asparagine synthetase B (glutamine-hydrolysing)